MNEVRPQARHEEIDALYEEAGYWHVNTGGETIHAKRVPGRFRRLKILAGSVWLIFFLGPYLRWDGRQAVLFDIPNRQYHLFGATVLPQDFWMLSLLLLFFAILLAVVTATAGRVFCGYFCFQTVWTDVFTWIEERLEGHPAERRRLDAAPWSGRKVLVKGSKHLLWISIGVFTGITFTLWFRDAYVLWTEYLTLSVHPIAWIAVGVFAAFTYFFAGFMREQVCFWLCPYARLQGVMYDSQTILPSYDLNRGEPRARLRRGQAAEGAQGDCIDCKQCVAVCPTGIDIRNGQQEGCITCGLCIDACDTVMDKTGRPRGLVRYVSLDELEGRAVKPVLKRPRVLVYASILTLALGGIIYGLASIEGVELHVLHERQPLYVIQSDGSIQNRYTLKILNKTYQDHRLTVSAQGPLGMELIGPDAPVLVKKGKVAGVTVFLRLPPGEAGEAMTPVRFSVGAADGADLSAERESVFAAPAR